MLAVALGCRSTPRAQPPAALDAGAGIVDAAIVDATIVDATTVDATTVDVDAAVDAAAPYRVRLPAISADGRTLAIDHAYLDARERSIEQVDFLAVPGLARRTRLEVATSYWEPTAADAARRAQMIAQVDARLAAGAFRAMAWVDAQPSPDELQLRWRTASLDADYDVATGRLALRPTTGAPRTITLAPRRIRCAQLSPLDPTRASQPPWLVTLAYDAGTRLALVSSGFPTDHGMCGVDPVLQIVRLP